jgi:hypothetical protein
MGGWWKCRQCAAYNRKSCGQCDWCGNKCQIFAQEPSSCTNPIRSYNVSLPNAGGGYGYGGKNYGSYGKWHWGKGRGSGGNAGGAVAPAGNADQNEVGAKSEFFKNRARNRAQKKTRWTSPDGSPDGPQNAEAQMDMDISGHLHGPDEAADLMEKMDTVQAMINFLVGRTDALSVTTRKSLETELAGLRIQKTRTKSYADQEVVLVRLVAARTRAAAETEQALKDAVVDRDMAAVQLKDAEDQLAELKTKIAEQEAVAAKMAAIAKANVEDTPSVFGQITDMATLLPQEHAQNFIQCIELLHQLAQNSTAAVLGASSSASSSPSVASSPTVDMGGASEQLGGSRGRARSVDAAAELPSRSRSHSQRLRGKQRCPDGHVLQELMENVKPPAPQNVNVPFSPKGPGSQGAG